MSSITSIRTSFWGLTSRITLLLFTTLGQLHRFCLRKQKREAGIMSKNAFSNWRWGVAALLVVCLFIMLAPSGMAQTSSTGALTGPVKDPSGAVIPNATVTATSLDTGAVRTSTTGSDGVYRFSLLPTGNYRVRMEASGFKPLEIPSAIVSVTETAVLDRNLEVGSQTQTV